ncbi:TPA: hypothetical protein EYP66_23610 [Candidatus Poribacteria bacterium]|nr:hypothetical protein [Candidatus Poribacteria bacterium]
MSRCEKKTLFANKDLTLFKIDVFDSKTQTLHQPQTVKQSCYQLMNVGHRIYDLAYLFFCQNYGQAFRFLSRRFSIFTPP